MRGCATSGCKEQVSKGSARQGSCSAPGEAHVGPTLSEQWAQRAQRQKSDPDVEQKLTKYAGALFGPAGHGGFLS